MFKDYFKPETDEFTIEVIKEDQKQAKITDKITETSSDLDQIKKDLRKAGLKIKNISPTNFGTEIIFFTKTDAEDAGNIIGTDKVKNNSVFVG